MILRENFDSVDPNSTETREAQGRTRWGTCTHHCSGSLLPVVMVIKGFGQDYEIFYLVASALLQKMSKPGRSTSVTLAPLVLGSGDSE